MHILLEIALRLRSPRIFIFRARVVALLIYYLIFLCYTVAVYCTNYGRVIGGGHHTSSHELVVSQSRSLVESAGVCFLPDCATVRVQMIPPSAPTLTWDLMVEAVIAE
jgi:hypothetical protein